MKRVKIQLEDIAAWDNLIYAAERAARGKRGRPEIQRFFDRLDEEIALLQSDILNGGVRVSVSTKFSIRDPKPRIIHAPCFRERVLHHALMAYVGPVLERAMVEDSFARRVGKGSVAAVSRCQQHIRRFPWYAKMDVRKYFASISHKTLQAVLRRRLKGSAVALVDRIIRAHEDAPGKGLPIGALTSQTFANYYLGPLDRFLFEERRVAGMVRYMDDVVFWDKTRKETADTVAEAKGFLQQRLDLEIKDPVQINRSAYGVTLCGYRVFPGVIRLAKTRRDRYLRALRRWEHRYLSGEIGPRELQRGVDAALAITMHADSRQWRRRVLSSRAQDWYEEV